MARRRNTTIEVRAVEGEASEALRTPARTTHKTVAIIGTRGYPSYYGGFETAVRHVAPALADRGWRVRVYGRRNGIRREATTDERVESVLTPGINSNALATLSFGFSSVLHAMLRKPDVALVMNVANGFWLPLLRLRGIPTVVNVDGIEWERDKWSRLGKAVFRLGARFTARFATELVFDAVAIGDYWSRHFHRTGTFIPYGGSPGGEARLEDDLVSGRYVLLVARFVPENGVGEFLEAAPDIVERCDLDIVLVGSAPPGSVLQETAEALAGSNPRVHLLGHIADDSRLFALWKHAAVYFHGHTVGGTNPALVQAMTIGARVVARDTIYNREVLGQAGLMCEGTPSSIAASVAEAIADPRPLEQMAAQRAAEHYTWELVADRYAGLLERQLHPPVGASDRPR